MNVSMKSVFGFEIVRLSIFYYSMECVRNGHISIDDRGEEGTFCVCLCSGFIWCASVSKFWFCWGTCVCFVSSHVKYRQQTDNLTIKTAFTENRNKEEEERKNNELEAFVKPSCHGFKWKRWSSIDMNRLVYFATFSQHIWSVQVMEWESKRWKPW